MHNKRQEWETTGVKVPAYKYIEEKNSILYVDFTTIW